MSHLPLFLHSPQTDSVEDIGPTERNTFRRYADSLIQDTTPWRVPSDTAFITYSNQPKKLLLERLYEAHQVPYITVAKDCSTWSHWCKVPSTLNFLKTHCDQYKYVIMTDGNDVMMTHPPEDLISDFESFNCDVVLGNTCRNWPRDAKLAAFEKEKYSAHGITHYHISSGFLMGRTDALIHCYSHIYRFSAWYNWISWIRWLSWVSKRDRPLKRPGISFLPDYIDYLEQLFCKGWFDDQLAWRRLHRKHYPLIQCDYKGLIMQRFDSLYLSSWQNAPRPPWEKC